MGEHVLSPVSVDRAVSVGTESLFEAPLARDPLLAEFDIPETPEIAFRRIEAFIVQRDDFFAINQLFAGADSEELQRAIAEAQQMQGDPVALFELLAANPERKAILLAGMRLYETGDDLTAMYELADSLIDQFAPHSPRIRSAPRRIYLNNDLSTSTAYSLEIICHRQLCDVTRDGQGNAIGLGVRFHGLLDMTAFADEDIEVRDKILAEEDTSWVAPNGIKKYLRRALDEKLPTIQPGLARLYAFRKTAED